MTEYLGSINGSKLKIAIIVARFNDLVTKRLLDGAFQTLAQNGVSKEAIDVYWVPGAFEIPRVAQKISQKGNVDGIITLGAVVRGETSHYESVCSGVTSGIAQIALEGKVPVMFGVLMTENMEQALNRAGGKAGNKGSECATGLLEMIDIEQTIDRE